MRRRPHDSTSKRHARATAPRVKIDLAGPLREVVYIFEREGERGGGFWWLVLDCGHAVARKRFVVRTPAAAARALFRPIEEKIAPRRVQCHYCGSGSAPADPWVMIQALGGPTP